MKIIMFHAQLSQRSMIYFSWVHFIFAKRDSFVAAFADKESRGLGSRPWQVRSVYHFRGYFIAAGPGAFEKGPRGFLRLEETFNALLSCLGRLDARECKLHRRHVEVLDVPSEFLPQLVGSGRYHINCYFVSEWERRLLGS